MRLHSFLFLAFICFGLSCTRSNSLLTESNIREVHQLYSMSLFEENQLLEIVNKRPELFKEDGPVIVAMQEVISLLNQLESLKLSQFDPDSDRESLYNTGANKEQADKIINEKNQGYFLMIQEMTWLVNVLPSAANGNWNAFQSTKSQLRAMLSTILQLPSDINMKVMIARAMPLVEDEFVYTVLWAQALRQQ